jgi:hypothetical protein
VDLKQPVLEKLFKLQTYMAPRMQATPNQHISMWEHSWKDWQNLQVSTVNLIDKIRTDFGRTVIDENEIPGDIENECESSGELRTLRKEINDDRHPMEYVTPLQPYVPIALSSLLMAVGSTDEGVNVLAKWLDAWACARGEKAMKYCDKAGLGEIALSKQLPEWFRFRAEFQMNVLLYQLIGSDNVIYRDFIKKHSEDPEHGFMTLARSKGITLDTALDSCENHSTSVGIRDENSDALATGIRTRVLQLLVDDENSYLMAERNFVLDLDVSDLENHYRRAQRLARFTPECLEPRHGDEEADLREKTLKPLTASYKITAGLLGIKVGERMKRIADSAYDRRRADDILKESMKVLRKGRNVLKEVRGHYRDAHADELLSRSVFTTFPHEDAYSLANGAIDDLNADQP